MRKMIGKILQDAEYVSCVILAFLAVLIGINVLSRRFFNAPIYGSTELVQYGTLAAICFASANTTWRREHPCVGLLIDALKPRGRSIARMLTDLASAVILAICGINLIPFFVEQVVSARVTETLYIPYWIISGLILFAIFTVMLVMAALTIYDVIAIVKPETNEEKPAAISLEGAGAIQEAQESVEKAEKKEGGD